MNFMQSSKRFILLILAGLLVVGAMSTARMARAGDDEAGDGKKGSKTYLAYNLWFEKPTNFLCINYKTGTMIPAGTEVKDISISYDSSVNTTGRPEIDFTIVGSGEKMSVGFEDNYHGSKTIQNYRDMMFTDKNFEELTKGFSKEAVEAIKAGVLVTGMTREEVICAYGPPPEHKTPKQSDPVWKYWMNRFGTKDVHFDKDGKTTYPNQSKLPNQI
jgi:hypothetical protein